MMEMGFDKGLAPNWNAPAIAVVSIVAQKSAICSGRFILSRRVSVGMPEETSEYDEGATGIVSLGGDQSRRSLLNAEYRLLSI